MRHETDRHRSPIRPESPQASPEAWAEMIRSLGFDRVTELMRTPMVLQVELDLAEGRLRADRDRKAA